MPTVLVGDIVINKHRGPFHGEETWQKMRESTIEFQAKAKEDDPLVKFLVPKSLLDQGKDPASVNPAVRIDWIDSLHEADFFNKKPAKVLQTHWNTWNDAFEALLPQWHKELAPAIHLCIAQGWGARHATAGKFLKPLKEARDADLDKAVSMRKETMKEARAKLGRLRQDCPSALRVSTFAMLDSEFKLDINMAAFTTIPWMYFHGVVQHRQLALGHPLPGHLGSLGITSVRIAVV